MKKADIGFIVDSSGSVSDADWTKVKFCFIIWCITNMYYANCQAVQNLAAYVHISLMNNHFVFYIQSLEFVSNVIQGFDIGKDEVRVGLIEYSAQGKLVFDFNKYYNVSDLSAAILNTTKTYGSTNTHLALDLAKNQLFTPSSGMRFVVCV